MQMSLKTKKKKKRSIFKELLKGKYADKQLY